MITSRSLSAAVAVLVTLASTGSVAAQEFVPAVVFDMGGKFDKSFNEAAYSGAERFKKETGWAPGYPSAREGWPAVVAAIESEERADA